MPFQSVMTVCIGNICRSPLAEAALRRACPRIELSSAGLHAPEGAPADPVASTIAAERGLDLSEHEARRFRSAEAGDCDLILVMEAGHKREILKKAPQLGGRVMLLTHWNGGQPIADPYRRSAEAHRKAADDILAAAAEWARRLGGEA